jgi:uncharacterized RDD family membrane protein YckC
MQVDCPQCGHVLEFSGERPLFCAYCGKPLSTQPTSQETTGKYDPEATWPAGSVRPEKPAVPESVGGYRLLRRLGSGGMGTVYEAEDAASGRRAALKLIAPEFAASPDAVERFRQEGRLASMIAHPRCVFVLGADEEAGRPYIVMELMSGATLQELTERNGPLPPEEAVAKILDVIEGLQEAHRLGFIHRDVKPSNCFLLPDGRVKVGDFGLAKSLVSASNLTKSGTFLGTLLYAPPEQIKGEGIDFRTDLYSASATLYHLLTGRAPFEGKDAAATLARTVSEDPPPLRRIRPEISSSLERVVLRGLAREREDRYRDLDEFRTALLPFAAGQLAPAGLGARWAAFIIDVTVLLPLWAVISAIIESLGVGPLSRVLLRVTGHVLDVLPWALCEGLWGWSPGKALLRLRVYTATGTDPPGLKRGLVRILVFYGCLWFASDLVGALALGSSHVAVWGLVSTTLELLGLVLLLSTMRERNGYRALHDLVSGTRVVRLPWPEKRPGLRSRRPDRLAMPEARAADDPVRLGPFLTRGTALRNDRFRILLGEDRLLGRKIVIRLVPYEGERVAAARRMVNRPTRLPWLSGGVHEGQGWDAFLAPQGFPLSDAVDARQPLTWGEARPLLLQLADELVAATADGTLPARLTVSQVWVQPNGRVQLLDLPLHPAAPSPPAQDRESDARRALTLLREAAVLALEGRERPEGTQQPIAAPVPAHAAAMLDRLAGVQEPYQSVEEFQVDLIGLQGEPTEINMGLRSGHLALLSALLFMPLLLMFGARYGIMHQSLRDLQGRLSLGKAAAAALADQPGAQAAVAAQLERDQAQYRALRKVVEWDWLARFVLVDPVALGEAEAGAPGSFSAGEVRQAVARAQGSSVDNLSYHVVYGFVVICGAGLLFVLWAFLTRGGLTFRLMGISLRRADGRPALRLQCAWRALLFWTPVVTLLALSLYVQVEHVELVALSFWLWMSALALLLGYMLLGLWSPTRSLHDRLSRTYLMPS